MSILLYHSVRRRVNDDLCQVTPATLRRHLELLLDGGVRFQTLRAYLRDLLKRGSTPKSFTVTFDDGYEDFIEHALPILLDLRIPACQFICPAHVGKTNGWNYRAGFRARHMDVSTLRGLAAFGVDVQPHGWSHRSFAQQSRCRLAASLDRCAQYFRDELGSTPSFLAYPYGALRPEQSACVAAAFDCGLAVTPLSAVPFRYAIPRTPMVEMMTDRDVAELPHAEEDAYVER